MGVHAALTGIDATRITLLSTDPGLTRQEDPDGTWKQFPKTSQEENFLFTSPKFLEGTPSPYHKQSAVSAPNLWDETKDEAGILDGERSIEGRSPLHSAPIELQSITDRP